MVQSHWGPLGDCVGASKLFHIGARQLGYLCTHCHLSLAEGCPGVLTPQHRGLICSALTPSHKASSSHGLRLPGACSRAITAEENSDFQGSWAEHSQSLLHVSYLDSEVKGVSADVRISVQVPNEEQTFAFQ